MNHFLNLVMSFLESEDGPTATEYAVMLALIIVLSLAAISGIGTTVMGIFTSVDGALPTGGTTSKGKEFDRYGQRNVPAPVTVPLSTHEPPLTEKV